MAIVTAAARRPIFLSFSTFVLYSYPFSKSPTLNLSIPPGLLGTQRIARQNTYIHTQTRRIARQIHTQTRIKHRERNLFIHANLGLLKPPFEEKGAPKPSWSSQLPLSGSHTLSASLPLTHRPTLWFSTTLVTELYYYYYYYYICIYRERER